MNQFISHCRMLIIFLVGKIHADTMSQLSTGDYSFVEEPPMSWFEADEHCVEEGGKLVEIDSEEENTALVEEINKRGYADRNMHFWIGLNELENDGDWRLASSSLKPTYQNWHEGEPNEG